MPGSAALACTMAVFESECAALVEVPVVVDDDDDDDDSDDAGALTEAC